MSLEIAIQENTAAIRELIAALTATAKVPVSEAAPAAAEEEEAPKPVDTPPVQEVETTAEEEAVVESPSDEPEITEAIIKKKLIELRDTKGKPVLAELFNRYGATAFPNLKPENYAAAYADACKMLEAE